MLALLLSASVAFFFFIVFGASLVKAIPVPVASVEKVLTGLILCNAIATLISLFFQINSNVLLLLVLCCFVLVFFIREEVKGFFLLMIKKKQVIFYALPFMVIGFLISLEQPQNYDTGLYHLQAVKWIEAYPVVPGLANLHGRFGFNPNVFTLFALTSMYGLFRQEIFSINYLVFIIIIVHFIDIIFSIYKKTGISSLFVFNTILFYTILRLSNNLSSPSPDFLATTIPIFIFARALTLAEQQQDAGSFQGSHSALMWLSFYVVTIKLSAIPVLLFAFCIILRYKPKTTSVAYTILMAMIIILPWVARNVILTGWLVYPFPAIDLFGFDWKVPVAKVIGEGEAIAGWARNPGKHYITAAQMNISGWFPLWWQQQSWYNKLLIIAAFCFPVIGMTAKISKRAETGYIKNVVCIVSFLGVLLWLFLAPDIRFGQAFIIIAATSPLFIFKFNVMPQYKPRTLFVVTIILLTGAFARSCKVLDINLLAYKFGRNTITPELIKVPAGVKFNTYKIDSIDIYTPSEGDRCFDHDVPCTPYPDHSLMLRGNSLQSGFRYKNNK